jgi:hypothetical protein
VNIALPKLSHLDLMSIFHLVFTALYLNLHVTYHSPCYCLFWSIICNYRPIGYHMIIIAVPMISRSKVGRFYGQAVPRLLPVPPLWAHRQLRVSPAKCLERVLYSGSPGSDATRLCWLLCIACAFKPALWLPGLAVSFCPCYLCGENNPFGSAV